MSDSFVSSDSVILERLRDRGPMSVTELAIETGVTATAIRQRLTRLLHQGLISREEQRDQESRGRGRPQHAYSLTQSGRMKAGQNFADLAMVLWQEICSIQNGQLKQQLLEGIARRLAERYSGQIKGSTMKDKMASIAEIFGERQIPVSVEEQGDLPILTIGACPYPELSTADRSICEMEESMISELLGSDVQIQEHGPGGCHCKFKSHPSTKTHLSDAGQ